MAHVDRSGIVGAAAASVRHYAAGPVRRVDGGAPDGTAVVSLGFEPGRVAGTLGWMLLCLIAVNIAMIVVVRASGGAHGLVLLRIFDFRQEGNVPNYFSALVILACSASAALNGRLLAAASAMERWRWYGLACVLLFLSLDEAAQFHEPLSRFRLGLEGGWEFLDERSWALYYTAAAAAVGIACLPWLRRLPPKTMWGLLLSGAVYVIAAAGFDELSQYFDSNGLLPSLATKGVDGGRLFPLAGEWLEVAAMILFLRVSLGYAFRRRRAVIVRLESRAASRG